MNGFSIFGNDLEMLAEDLLAFSLEGNEVVVHGYGINPQPPSVDGQALKRSWAWFGIVVIEDIEDFDNIRFMLYII